jgi:uncharacterized protein (DUF3084 family)
MKEQGDDLKDQLNQAKEQGNNVIKRLDNNSKIMVEVLNTVNEERIKVNKDRHDAVNQRLDTNEENLGAVKKELNKQTELLVRVSDTMDVVVKQYTDFIKTRDSTSLLTRSVERSSSSTSMAAAIGLPASIVGSAPSSTTDETGATPTGSTSSPVSLARGCDSA